MSSNKVAFTNQEPTEDSRERQNHPNCSFCFAFIPNTESNATHLKCEECLRKMDSIPSGFSFKLVNEVKEYECPICLSLIKNATELTCTHLMCKACLEFYEKSEVQKDQEKAKFFCSVCQTEYKPDKKKMVGSLDRVIQASLDVKCLQKECNWVGCIKDYKYHEKDCKYILTNCRHANCEVKVQRQLMDSHVGRCPFRSIQCEHCDEIVVFQHLNRHLGQCSKFPVTCPNEDCATVLKRSEIKTHCETECNFQQIECPYFEFGCTFKGTRGKMVQHNETFKVKHEFLLLVTVKNIKEKNEQEKKEKDSEIEQLKESNTKKDVTLNELKHDVNILKNQLENVRQQLKEKIERNKEQTNKCFEELNEKQTEQSKKVDHFKKNIDNLETFAERVSKLHSTLSDINFQRNRHNHSTIFQEDYDKNNEVTKWNETIKEANEDDNKCKYLETLKGSLNQYKETIYSSTYVERFGNLSCLLPAGVLFNRFIRIECFSGRPLCVKIFGTSDDLEKEIERKDVKRTFKVQNSSFMCSYYVGECLRVVLGIAPHLKVYLLHNSNEEEKLLLSREKEGHIVKDISKYFSGSSIVFYLKE